MAADAANSESYFLETGTKEKVGMSQCDRLQRSRSLLCSHHLQDALYLYFLKKKDIFAFQSIPEKNPRDGIMVEKSGLKLKTAKKD